jgi:hypothetical protein
MKSKNLEQNPRVTEFGIMVPEVGLKVLERKKRDAQIVTPLRAGKS